MDTIKLTLRGNIVSELLDFMQEYNHYVYDIDIKYEFFVDTSEVKLCKKSDPIIELTISPAIYDTLITYLDFLKIGYDSNTSIQ